MAAHLYWRLNVTANNGGAALAIAEIAMFTAGAASTATTGGTPSASTTSGAQTASLAFDGSTSTYWQATTTTGTIQYQFASAVDITSYTVTNNTTPSNAPNAWTFEYSDDGSSWTVADTVARQKTWGGSAGSAETRTYTVGANAGNTVQGVRIWQPGPNGQQTTPSAPNQIQLGKAPPTAARTVSGTVKVNGTGTSGLLVRAYAKATGEYLGQATTSGGGSYTINCGGYFSDVEVIAFNPTTYQALIYDQVAPQ